MKKHPARRSTSTEASRPGFVQQRILPLLEVIVALKDGLRELVVSSGMQVLEALLEQDRTNLCGPAKKKQTERKAYRYGYDQGQLVMGGRKVAVAKPRVRSIAGEERSLPSWEAFRADRSTRRACSRADSLRRDDAQIRTQFGTAR